jgi:outer membrane lipoprotein carrier protein
MGISGITARKRTGLFACLACCLGCLMLWSATVIAASAEDQNAVQHLSRLLVPVATFSADFEQTLLSAQGQTLQAVKGQLKAKRPGLFYWHTLAPLEQTVVTDGTTVWIHDPDLEQVTIQSLDQQLSSTPALLLSGQIERINESYDVSYTNEGGDKPQQPDFLLRPRGPDSLFQWLTLHFTDDTLYAMSLVDTLGQKTLLRFSGARKNPLLPDSDFQFDIPAGVDVIRQTAE